MSKVMLMFVAFSLGIAIASKDKILIAYNDTHKIATSVFEAIKTEFRPVNDAYSLNDKGTKSNELEFLAGQYQKKSYNNESEEAKHSELVYDDDSPVTMNTPLAKHTPAAMNIPEAAHTSEDNTPAAENTSSDNTLAAANMSSENTPEGAHTPSDNIPAAENTLSDKTSVAENTLSDKTSVAANTSAENTPAAAHTSAAVNTTDAKNTPAKQSAPVEEDMPAEARIPVTKSAIFGSDKLTGAGLNITSYETKSEKYAYVLGYYYASLLESDLNKMKAAGIDFKSEKLLQGFSGGLIKESFLSEEELSSIQEELNDEFIMKSKPLFRKSKKNLAEIAKGKGARMINADDLIIVKKQGVEAKDTAVYHFEITMSKVGSPEKNHFEKKVNKDEIASHEMLQAALKYSGIGGESEYYTLGKNIETHFLLKEINPWDVIVYNIKTKTL